MRRWIVAATVMLLAAGGLVVWTSTSWNSGESREIIEIAPEPFVRRIAATGEIHSSNSEMVGCPSIPRMWNFTITQMAPEGQQVPQGAPVLAFDGKSLMDDLQVKQSELDTTRKELDRTRLEEREKQEALVLERAERQAELARLERKLEVPAELQQRIELQKIRLDHELATEELRLIDLRIEAQDRATAARIDAAESNVRWLEHEVARATENIAKFQVPAPRAGFVVHVPDWNGEKPKVGERVWKGRSVLEIADLSVMEVNAEIAEPDAGFVEVGQRVEIRLDASPDRLFTGEVVRLGRLFRTRSAEDPSMVFDAIVSIDEPDPELMRPGMASQVTILAATPEPHIHIPESAVRVGADGPAVDVLRSGGEVERVAIELGPRWDGRVVVTNGLETGDRVLAGRGSHG